LGRRALARPNASGGVGSRKGDYVGEAGAPTASGERVVTREQTDVWHTHHHAVEGTRKKPDYLVTDSTLDWSSVLSVKSLIELFNDDKRAHQGKMIAYAEDYLKSDTASLRPFFISALTDMKTVQFWRAEWKDSVIRNSHTPFMSLTPKHGDLTDRSFTGWRRLLGLIALKSDQFGYNIPKIPGYTLKGALGCGSTSVVFKASSVSHTEVAIKLFHTFEQLESERLVLEKLATESFCPAVVDVVRRPPALVMSPVGTSIPGSLSKAQITRLLELICFVHSRKVVIRDLESRHLMESSQGIFLIDYGCCVVADTLRQFAGSSRMAPTSILELLCQNPLSPVSWKPVNDLESLVKVFICRADHDLNSEVYRIDKRDFVGLAQFWRKTEAGLSDMWKQALSLAKKADVAGLLKNLLVHCTR